MIIRFVMVLLMVTVAVFGYTYFTSTEEKKFTFKWGTKLLVSFAVASVIIIAVMFINNFSGI